MKAAETPNEDRYSAADEHQRIAQKMLIGFIRVELIGALGRTEKDSAHVRPSDDNTELPPPDVINFTN